jgi:hypothetical protein
MSRFATFAVLYMTAFLVMLVEQWRYDYASLLTLLVSLVVFTRVTRASFLLFLLGSGGYFLASGFPDVPNHVNLFLLCNAALALILLSTWVGRGRNSETAFLELAMPAMRSMLVTVYLVAGFHKLNRDFLDPEVSCAGSVINWTKAMLASRIVGVPAVAVLALTVAAVLVALARVRASTRTKPSPGIVAAGTLLLLAGVVVGFLWSSRVITITEATSRAFVLATAILVLVWQLVEGALLLVPRLQAFVLISSLAMHSLLALLGFVDFQALVFALIFAFVPEATYLRWERRATVQLGALGIHRTHAYYLLNLAAGLLAAAHPAWPVLEPQVVSGLLFDLAVLTLLWPVLTEFVGAGRAGSWGGVPVLPHGVPRWILVCPAVLLLFGMTPYLGLRTAGNLTMFSNLRTEAGRSNHLLLAGNTLRLWREQQEPVTVIALDPRWTEGIYQIPPLAGMQLPEIEFRKLVTHWARAGAAVPVTLEHRGRTWHSPDITRDPAWRVERPDWRTRWADFRVIQPEGANMCRW